MQMVILRDNTTATGNMSLSEIGHNQQHTQEFADSHSYTGIYNTHDAWLLQLCSTATLEHLA